MTETSTPHRHPSTIVGFTPRFLRQWHRWIALPSAIFLLLVSLTGFLLAFTEFFGEEERLREATRDLVSPATLASPDAFTAPLARAVATARARWPSAPVDRVEMTFKGNQPTVALYTGRRGGGEDRKLVFDARTGALLRDEAYVDKPFLTRLHSGEAFGDGGLLAAMLWALALVLLTLSGFLIYLRMHPRRPLRGIRKLFW